MQKRLTSLIFTELELEAVECPCNQYRQISEFVGQYKDDLVVVLDTELSNQVNLSRDSLDFEGIKWFDQETALITQACEALSARLGRNSIALKPHNLALVDAYEMAASGTCSIGSFELNFALVADEQISEI
ncbi:hypothetical protein [Vibrio agarivorans]|uniref:hypothetical protein n=1 Tax=Vibrio agarivorans TaxID=153622 RepID=UPI0025B4FB0F|nr:hypothetical protein [Vibrio agarivorans]MDN3661127.1 hypothetical protein [Vibrio agarivorans]